MPRILFGGPRAILIDQSPRAGLPHFDLSKCSGCIGKASTAWHRGQQDNPPVDAPAVPVQVRMPFFYGKKSNSMNKFWAAISKSKVTETL